MFNETIRLKRYFSHHRPNDGRSISRNVASLNILVHDVINLFYCIMNTEQTSKNIITCFICYLCSMISTKHLLANGGSYPASSYVYTYSCHDGLAD